MNSQTHVTSICCKERNCPIHQLCWTNNNITRCTQNSSRPLTFFTFLTNLHKLSYSCSYGFSSATLIEMPCSLEKLSLLELLCLPTIGVKIVETLLSFRGYFTLGSNIPHPPHSPGQCCVIFCFLRPLTTAVQH